MSTTSSPSSGRLFIYSATIFTGAFLLFQVQPLIGKFILPWFGGGPGVWTTCLLFFQAMLLAGYAYAHVIATRLTVRRQVVVHLTLLAVALLTLPILPDESWRPAAGDAPIARILGLLTATIGAPYLLLSATGPLVQSWFGRSEPGQSPYRLYALSNAGSLLALVTYPLVIEPWLGRGVQAWSWSIGWVAYAVLLAVCARRVRRQTAALGTDGAVTTTDAAPESEPSPTWGQRLLWLGLSATASVWLLATTTKLTIDVAAMPFLWVLPLGLYLLTFILCFDHPRWYRPGVIGTLAMAGIGLLCELLVSGSRPVLPVQIALYGGTLWAVAMVCHGELFRLRPATRFLTAFYLWVALGGALGGLLVSVAAPLLLNRYVELQAGMWVFVYLVAIVASLRRSVALAITPAAGAALLLIGIPALRIEDPVGWHDAWQAWQGEFLRLWDDHWLVIVVTAVVTLGAFIQGRQGLARGWTARIGLLPMLFTVGFGGFLIVQITGEDRHALAGTRNFYGTLKVFEFNTANEDGHYHLLRHGATTHGLQFTAQPQATWPATYYGEMSGVGRAIAVKGASGEPLNLGVVGLGTGTIAAYTRPGDVLRFYEIDEAVEPMARRYFTYLDQTQADVTVTLGDARLSLEAERQADDPVKFDVLVLDAFSSDAIPVHLLTREALELYEARLKSDGILAIHISNRFLRLRPVVENLAIDAGLSLSTIADEPDSKNWWLYNTTWVLLARDPEQVDDPTFTRVRLEPIGYTPEVGVWTDDFSSLLPIVRW